MATEPVPGAPPPPGPGHALYRCPLCGRSNQLTWKYLAEQVELAVEMALLVAEGELVLEEPI